MKLTRREAMAMGLGATAVAMLPMRVSAAGQGAVAEFTGGAEAGEGNVTLTAPEIAENGNTVPMSVSAPGAVAIALIATGNPTPTACIFNFGPAAGTQAASTRIRLAGTQDVIAVARMADGSYIQSTQSVKVTIGGCGG
ncbi:MAG: thiosulfate oxidation carrier protein SoxY [Methylococcales bacterium]|nr:thiosulfate oxidation carrier protein SoxY [Methylococcales bacterium]